ncbi:MAG: sulfatase-like hydrolase/transferase, partial [Acidimicrobiales bacterium]
SPLGDLVDDAVDSYQAMISLDPDASGPQSIEEATSTVTTTPTATTLDQDGTADAVDEARNTDTANAGFPVLQIDAFQGLVDSIEADEEPALHFLHLQLPHSPYRFLPDGRAYEAGGFGPGGDLIGTRGPEQAEADAERQRLLLQVGYVDRLVGQLVDRLHETALYEETAVVVTSDHGSGFVPGQSHRGLEGETLDRSLYPDILYVPLIVKAPQLEAGTVSDDNVESIDVLPTIADILGLPLPWEVDGRSLFGPARTDPEKQFNKVDMGGGGLGGFGGAVQLSDRVRFDGDEVLAENLARNVNTLLRADAPGHEFYARTEDGDLVGTPVEDLPAGADAGARLAADEGLDAVRSYRSSDEVIPTHLTGQIEDGPSGDQRLVVAIDGVIAGVAPTFVDGDVTHHVDLMLDPTALSGPTPRHIQAFLLTGRGDRRQLAALRT